MRSVENIVIVSSETRLQKLKAKFNTVSQAKFYMSKKGVSFQEVEEEDQSIQNAISVVNNELSQTMKTKVIERAFLPNYIFSDRDLVVVVGQDGLVANTAKYAHDIPIIGVNPDVAQFDGVLLPFNLQNYERAVDKVIEGNYRWKDVSMAKASLNDGQELLAFNDLFIGPSNHSSARYKLRFNGKEEQQSSSGIIISTGAGSTGWLSSLINMSNGIQRAFSGNAAVPQQRFDWDSNQLIYVVREPFLSKTSNIKLSVGIIQQNVELEIESLMAKNGLIFSDGVHSDYIEFNSGSIAKIRIAQEHARLVTSVS